MRLANRRALITGASRGIGRAIALGYGREGADVGVNYVQDERAARECCEEIERMGRRAAPLRADVSQKGEVERMFREMEERLGPPDILVNNAAVIDWVDFLEVSEDLWDRIIDINLKGTFLCSQVAARLMRARGGGRIVNIASVAGTRPTNIFILPYMASKAGILMLTKGMAKALGPHGIRVNAVILATTPTDQNRERLARPGWVEGIVAATPLGRLGTPEDAVGAAVFFASAESDYCTGAALHVDGGFGL